MLMQQIQGRETARDFCMTRGGPNRLISRVSLVIFEEWTNSGQRPTGKCFSREDTSGLWTLVNCPAHIVNADISQYKLIGCM